MSLINFNCLVARLLVLEIYRTLSVGSLVNSRTTRRATSADFMWSLGKSNRRWFLASEESHHWRISLWILRSQRLGWTREMNSIGLDNAILRRSSLACSKSVLGLRPGFFLEGTMT